MPEALTAGGRTGRWLASITTAAAMILAVAGCGGADQVTPPASADRPAVETPADAAPVATATPGRAVDPCALASKVDAERLAGTPLQEPVPESESCTYTGPAQTIKVTTAFGASLGTMKGTGEFSVAGGLGFGYANGSFGLRVTRNFARKKSLLNSITGIPVGVMGLLVAHRVKFNVGFNAHVLAAGVYFELRTAYGMTAGSTLGAVGTLGTPFVECRGVGLGVWAHYGIGYTILKPVVDAINRFIDLLNVGPIQIPHLNAAGGIASRPWELYTNEEVTPDVKLCGHTPVMRRS